MLINFTNIIVVYVFWDSSERMPTICAVTTTCWSPCSTSCVITMWTKPSPWRLPPSARPMTQCSVPQMASSVSCCTFTMGSWTLWVSVRLTAHYPSFRNRKSIPRSVVNVNNPVRNRKRKSSFFGPLFGRNSLHFPHFTTSFSLLWTWSKRIHGNYRVILTSGIPLSRATFVPFFAVTRSFVSLCNQK